MATDDWNLGRIARILGYLLLGGVGTIAVALAVLSVGRPVQPLVYDLLYLQQGPSSATTAAVLVHFLLASLVGLALVTLVTEQLSTSGEYRRPVGVAMAALGVALLAFLVVAWLGLAAFLTSLLVLGLTCLAIPVVLRVRFRVRSGALPAFVGGVPVVLLLLLLAGFGIGWGWGYVVTAEEVPDPAEEPPADLGEVPSIRDDLLVDGDCEQTTDGRRRCYLQLRGYEHELAAARFLADHGLRCSYSGTAADEQASILASADGTVYRLRCQPHGD